MIIPDINILIYAINRDNIYHSDAKKWVETVFSGDEQVGLPWIVILGFLRIITNPKIMPVPLPAETAVEIIDQWMELPCIDVLHPAKNHWKIFKEIIGSLGSAGNITSDAHLAAMAIENSATLYSTDNDFSRFPYLRWKNPLVKSSSSKKSK